MHIPTLSTGLIVTRDRIRDTLVICRLETSDVRYKANVIIQHKLRSRSNLKMILVILSKEYYLTRFVLSIFGSNKH
jgi:hypothetical protein